MDQAAPVKGRVVLAALLAALLLAFGVTALQVFNARSLRGTLEADALVPAEESWVPIIETVETQGSLIRIRGALVRPGEAIEKANVRLGLLADGEVTLLNTQMVRRPDLATQYGCDDHCGAAALLDSGKLQEGSYALVFVENGEKLVRTGRTLNLRAQEAAHEP